MNSFDTKAFKSTKTVSILGTPYKLSFKTPEDDAKLDDVFGYEDYTSKEIVVCDLQDEDIHSIADRDFKMRAIARHECIHAFLDESGLGTQSWADNEELVDWFALQFPKIMDAFIKAHIER